jgi:predicted dinucleotide-utilizing enzyme
MKLDAVCCRQADLIVEVCHPAVVAEWGSRFLEHADLMVGSPTAFADEQVERTLRQAAETGCHGLYVPSGALWGAADIKRVRVLSLMTGAPFPAHVRTGARRWPTAGSWQD